MIDLTRRQLLVTVSAGAVVKGLEAIIGSKSSAHERKPINFFQALSDRSLMQGYLERLVKSMPNGQYAEVIYDEGGSKVRLELEQSFFRIMNDPHMLREEAASYLHFYDPKFRKLGLAEKEIRLNDLINSHEGKAKLERYLQRKTEATILETKRAYAFTVRGAGFDKKTKSKLFVFGKSFEGGPIRVGKNNVHLPPSEELLKALLEHELSHAADNYKGMELEKGLVIDGSNYFGINPLVKEFIFDSRAYTKQIQLSRKLTKPDLNKEFYELPPVHLYSTYSLVKHIYDKGLLLKPENLSPYELACVASQLKDIKRKAPEILKYAPAQIMFRTFGVN